MWKTGTPKEEQSKFEGMSVTQETEYFRMVEEANTRVNDLKKKIF